MRSFAPEPGDEDAELLDGAGAPRVIFGHTHVPVRPDGGRRSSSSTRARSACRFDGDPRAAYALLDGYGRIEHRRVAYDHGASAERVRGLGGEWAEIVARRIERATMDV